MKDILEEIKHCRERNLILFEDLKKKLNIVEGAFLKNIVEVDELDIREEKGKQVLHINDKELEVHSKLEDKGVYYVAVEVEKEGNFENDGEYDLFYSKKLAK